MYRQNPNPFLKAGQQALQQSYPQQDNNSPATAQDFISQLPPHLRAQYQQQQAQYKSLNPLNSAQSPYDNLSNGLMIEEIELDKEGNVIRKNFKYFPPEQPRIPLINNGELMQGPMGTEGISLETLAKYRERDLELIKHKEELEKTLKQLESAKRKLRRKGQLGKKYDKNNKKYDSRGMSLSQSAASLSQSNSKSSWNI